MKFLAVVKEVKNAQSIVLLLPGRGQMPRDILSVYHAHSSLKSTFIAIKPENEWYPLPRGANDQTEAVFGLSMLLPSFDRLIKKIEDKFDLKRKKIGLVGFSAGAVIAIQTAIYSDEPFAAVVSHAGAILEPDSLPVAEHKTPFLLTHSKDDNCFSWDERYLPMRAALEKQGYNVECKEHESNGHSVTAEDIEIASIFLANQFD